MKKMLAMVLFTMVFLVGCGGGHGFQGTYDMKVEGETAEMRIVASMFPTFSLEIGDDYIKNIDSGDKENFKSIERKGYKLVFVRENGREMTMDIEGKKLIQYDSGMKITMTKQ